VRKWLKRSALIVAILLVAFVSIVAGPPLYARLAYDLVPLTTDGRVLYETGAEDLASTAANHIDALLNLVAMKQQADFKDRTRIRIYIFNDARHRMFFGNTWLLRARDPRGNANGDEIYISPRVREDRSLVRILTHELSHVHLHQHLGMARVSRDLPSWFLEGLAVYVSEGGGAERASRESAIAALRNGRRFEPAITGGLFTRKTASSYSMPDALFYRQAGIFVEYLDQRYPRQFKRALTELIRGAYFRDIWSTHFGMDIAQLWTMYLEELER
jgi:hypothetical protein